MDILFFLLFLICFIAIIVGIIKPKAVIRWGSPDKRNRKSVLKFYGIGLILFFVLFSLTIDTLDATEDYSKTANLSESDNSQEIVTETEEINNDISATGDLEVHFIDVGQADSILITIGFDSMLIDAGNNDDSDLVVNYIKSQGISDLDYVIGTHPHEDHIGGLDAVINSFEIGKVLMPKQKSTSETFKDVLLAIQRKGLKVTSPKVGDTYNLGKAAWTIIAPSKDENEETNNASIVIRLEYENNSFMFTGDAEEMSELEILKTGNLETDVLKVGHHGSNSSTSIDFLNEVRPKYAVISVGLDNSYRHPHSEVIDRLTNNDIKILRTDELGTIIFTSDGNYLNYIADKSGVDSPVIQSEKVTSKPESLEYNSKAVEISELDKKAELVTITNISKETVDMKGWKLISVTGNQIFLFPQFSLSAGASVTVGGYDSIDISDLDWEDGQGIWSNSKSDPAELYDASGNLVSVFND